jgi:hypothetical protein
LVAKIAQLEPLKLSRCWEPRLMIVVGLQRHLKRRGHGIAAAVSELGSAVVSEMRVC